MNENDEQQAYEFSLQEEKWRAKQKLHTALNAAISGMHYVLR